MPLITHQLTSNAIALLVAGTDSNSIEKSLFHCNSCGLYYTWVDLADHSFDKECGADRCPGCGSADLMTNAEVLLDLPQASLSFSSLA